MFFVQSAWQIRIEVLYYNRKRCGGLKTDLLPQRDTEIIFTPRCLPPAPSRKSKHRSWSGAFALRRQGYGLSAWPSHFAAVDIDRGQGAVALASVALWRMCLHRQAWDIRAVKKSWMGHDTGLLCPVLRWWTMAVAALNGMRLVSHLRKSSNQNSNLYSKSSNIIIRQLIAIMKREILVYQRFFAIKSNRL